MSETDGITVTIKYGKGYEETWAVFRGSSAQAIRTLVIDYFGVEAQAVSELSAHELVVNMTNVAHGTGNAAATLGAVAVPKASTFTYNAAPTGNPWAGIEDTDAPAESPAEPVVSAPEGGHPHQALIDALNGAGDLPALKRVWATNQAAFTDPDVQAAYKARGKELSK
jgi:hypothetical protein